MVSVNFSYQFGFNSLFDVIKMEWNIMIDSLDPLAILWFQYPVTTAQTPASNEVNSGRRQQL